jgi:hypothetical protein
MSDINLFTLAVAFVLWFGVAKNPIAVLIGVVISRWTYIYLCHIRRVPHCAIRIKLSRKRIQGTDAASKED